MAKIDEGGLYFKADLDNDKLLGAIHESINSFNGLSDVADAAGQSADSSFRKSSEGIKAALTKAGEACDIHVQKIASLESQYKKLQEKAGKAFMSGRDAEYSKILQSMGAIEGEIAARKSLLKEMQKYSDILEHQKNKIEENAQAHVSLRSRLTKLKEEMALLIDQGVDEQSEAYRKLAAELGRLQDIQADIAQQGLVLSNDEADFQGIIQGVSGLSGALSAATGAISLFAGENEDLQKVMTKVQSVMAITIGLQQVSQTLNKDSAFQLVTLNKLKAWWAKVVEVATTAETAETAAKISNTAAQEAQISAASKNALAQEANAIATTKQSIAAAGGVAANFTLAGAFRAVGFAIKSIPVFGWIVAGLSAIVALVSHFSSKAKEAKKRAEEMSKSMTEMASKPISSLMKLQAEWISLGDNMQAKQKFIEKNRKSFEELNIAINDTYDAERRLMSPEHTRAFIQAQLMKAKGSALIESEDYKNKLKEAADIESKIMDAKESKKKIRDYKNHNFKLEALYKQDLKIKELQEKLNPINEYLQETVSKSVQITRDGQKKLDKLNEEALKKQANTVAGKRALLESELEDLKRKRESMLAIDKKSISEYDKKIKDKQSEIESLDIKTDYAKDRGRDPFIENLEKRKKAYEEYLKWINSDDDKIRSAAGKQFAGLLKEGDSYVEYLRRQRDALLSISNRTQEQNKNLVTLSSAIAEEGEKTILEVFERTTHEQIDAIDTIVDKIESLKRIRDEIGSEDPLRRQKEQILDNSLREAEKQAERETRALYAEYAAYYDQRIDLHKKYLSDIELLERSKEKANTNEEKQKIERTIEERKKRYDKDVNKVDNYDDVIAAYGSFEQRKQAIIDEFEEKRQKAQERRDREMIENIEKAQKEVISKLTLDEMIKNPDWSKLFEDLDEITTAELERLQAMLEEKKLILGVELSPRDFDVISDKIKSIKAEIRERNPFKGLAQAVKDYGSAADSVSKKKALSNMFSSAAGSIGLVREAFDSVVDGIKKMGVQMDEETEQILSNISGLLDGAGQLATGIASANPLDIIKGSIGLFTSAVDLLNTKDRDAQRNIRNRTKAVDNLQRAYDDLSRSIDRALGGDKYRKQKEAINNLREQERHLREMERAERGKKKSDDDKIKEYQDRQTEIRRKQEDIINGMRDEILGIDARAAAEQLGDAFISAFTRGEDALKAFGRKADEVVANIMKQMLVKKLLEEPIGKILDKYSKKWVDKDGNFSGFDSVINDAEAMGEELKNLAKGFQEKGADVLKKLGNIASSGDTTLTGGVKGVTEETAGIVAGQLNAIRMRQAEATELMRQQLMYMSRIANNTSYNKHLESIDRKLSNVSNDSLRSRGVANE